MRRSPPAGSASQLKPSESHPPGACSSGYCLFVYQYRDAGNYKVGGELLLRGEPTPALESDLRIALGSDSVFVAEQVGVPPLYAELWKYSGGPSEDDHAFHEFLGFQPVTRADLSRRPWGDLEELVRRLTSAAEDWNFELSPHHLTVDLANLVK